LASSDERRSLDQDDLQRMNLPPEFWRVKVTDITDPYTKEKIGRYLKNFPEMFKKGYGLMLYGDPGVGKTSIAAMVAKEARSWKKTVFFTMIWELRELEKSRYQYEGASILERCRNVDVLVLDGFVEEDINERVVNARTLEQLITFRGQRGKLTIVTTRIDKKEFNTGKGLKQFNAGTEAYLFKLKVRGENKRTTRKQDMRDAILGEDD
jgi:DNA replication protein DnaC